MSGPDDSEQRGPAEKPADGADDLELIPLESAPLPPPETPWVDDASRVDLAHYPRCPECGYSLYGLPSLRCPECGASIRSEDISRTYTRQELDRTAFRERLCTWIGLSLILLGIMLTFVVGRRHFPLNVCLAGPLVGLTAGLLLYRAGVGDKMPVAFISLGIAWALTGVFFALAR